VKISTLTVCDMRGLVQSCPWVQFFLTRPDPTHQVYDPTRPDPALTQKTLTRPDPTRT
jgi:hypothetical protein